MKDFKHAFSTFESISIPHHADVLPLEKKRYALHQEKDWEIILVFWGGRSQTPVHLHGGSQCWTRILKGELREKRYSKNLVMFDDLTIGIHDKSYLDDDMAAHRVMNEYDSVAISLHLYVAPIKSYQYYDEATGLWLTETSEAEEWKEIYEEYR